MKLCNIKITIFLKSDLFTRERNSKKVIMREDSLVFTSYHHTPSIINVTGIKSKSDITAVMELLEAKYKVQCDRYRIDSMMYSHRDKKRIKIDQILKVFDKENGLYYIDYHPELFTGIFLKPIDRLYPTINLFYTGSYQIIGAKNFSIVDWCKKFVEELIAKCVGEKCIDLI